MPAPDDAAEAADRARPVPVTPPVREGSAPGGCGVLRWRRKTNELEQPRQAGNDSYAGETGDQDGRRGALAAAGHAKHERDKGRADRLAKEARRTLDRAGPAAAMAWRARNDGAVVRRLE